jgi:H+-translocating NAD(P) transhydrogenase subunit alpha
VSKKLSVNFLKEIFFKGMFSLYCFVGSLGEGVSMDVQVSILFAFVLMLAIFVGFEVIAKVPSILHTPLMSETNAISGITLVGAFLAAASTISFASSLGLAAIFFATINVVGGYLVTDRMLTMFKKKSSGDKQ